MSNTYTIPTTLSTGKTLIEGHQYSFSISLIQTRDGSSSITGSTNILTRSRSFFNFVPLPASAPPNVILPFVIPGPVLVYSFKVTMLTGKRFSSIRQWRAAMSTRPAQVTRTLPRSPCLPEVGNDLYGLYLFNGFKYSFKARVVGGVPYNFGRRGVNRFLVLGIEKEAALNPNNPTAFITGLTFTRSGTFSGTMTPITESAEAEVIGGGWMPSPAGAYKRKSRA